jgi:rhodanese-related sulfurtransferase
MSWSPEVASIKRLAPRTTVAFVPRAIRTDPEPGLFVVDATWGSINPIELAPGVRTVAELEVIEHVRRGGAIVDSRRRHFFDAGTIPGAIGIPHDEVRERIEELDPDEPTVFFCNGPQCAATPRAIRRLLSAGYPASGLLYYRGGMHDWLTLGLPAARPTTSGET